MHARLFLISLALSSAACTQSPVVSEGQGEAPVVFARAVQGDDNPAQADPVDFEDNAEDGPARRAFAYSWPAEVSAIPALASQLAIQRDEALAKQKSDWQEARITFAGEDCATCVNLGFEREWKVVADIPGWLSLSSDLYLYTGGAHGTYGRSSLLWDRENGEGVRGIDMFESAVALENALGAKLCDALDREREKRRGTKVDRASGDVFTDCPGLDEASVFIGSSDGLRFDRIGIYFGPYVAGSFAEGAFELDFPVTASVLDAVKPAYADAFRVRG